MLARHGLCRVSNDGRASSMTLTRRRSPRSAGEGSSTAADVPERGAEDFGVQWTVQGQGMRSGLAHLSHGVPNRRRAGLRRDRTHPDRTS
jgi:hypothetical protein